VAEQETQPDSTLKVYRQLLELRKQLRHEVGLTWLDSPKGVLLFQRGESWICILNASSVAVELPEGRVIATSSALKAGVLAPGQAAWLLRSPHQ
jgi:alpha-glucosidase